MNFRNKCLTEKNVPQIFTYLVIFSMIRCLFNSLFYAFTIQPSTAPPNLYAYLHLTFVSTPVQPTTVGINSFELVNAMHSFRLLAIGAERRSSKLWNIVVNESNDLITTYYEQYYLHMQNRYTRTHLSVKCVQCASHFQRQIIFGCGDEQKRALSWSSRLLLSSLVDKFCLYVICNRFASLCMPNANYNLLLTAHFSLLTTLIAKVKEYDELFRSIRQINIISKWKWRNYDIWHNPQCINNEKNYKF